MRPFRTILVDDEPQALRLLSKNMSDFPQLAIVGAFTNPNEALGFMKENYFDLVFIDIQMPQKNGFELVANAREAGLDFHAVFVTAFDEYAIDAIRASDFEYLMKPVGHVDLEQVIVRLEHKIAANSPLAGFDRLMQMVTKHRVKVPDGKGFNYYLPDEIVFIESDGEKSEVILKNRRDIVEADIDSLQEMLADYGFARISPEFLINKEYLVRINSNTNICRLNHDSHTFELQVAKEYIKDLADFVN